MVRKLCFELVMTLPGMTSKDEEALGRINNSSVAFVASIFFALHMACQPYDNRRGEQARWRYIGMCGAYRKR